MHSPTLSATRTRLTAPKERGAPYAPSSRRGRSQEERIEAITAAALDLKEKILIQSKKFADVSAQTSVMDYSPVHSEEIWNSRDEQHPSHADFGHDSLPVHVTRVSSGFVSHDLPGVGVLQECATQAERVHEEEEAARKIQAAYRGYSIRKSLRWKLPTGGTLAEVMQGARRGGDGVEEKEDVGADTVMLTPRKDGVVSDGGDGGEAGASLPHQHYEPKLSVPAVPTEPWKKDGGDNLSVINIFTRKHLQDYAPVLAEGGRNQNGKMPSPIPRSEPLSCHTVSSPSSVSAASGNYSYSGIFEDSAGSMPAIPSSSSVSSAVELSTGNQSGRAAGGKGEGGALGEVKEELSTSGLSTEYSTDSFLCSISPMQKSPTSSQSAPHSIIVTPSNKTHTLSNSLSSTKSSTVSSGRRGGNGKKGGGSRPSVTPSSSSSVDSSLPVLIPPLPNHSGSSVGENLEALVMAARGQSSPQSLEQSRAIPLAHHEATDIVQLLKSQQQADNQKGKEEMVKRHRDTAILVSLEEAKKMREEVEEHMREHSNRLAQVEEQSSRAILDLTARLHQVQSSSNSMSSSSVGQVVSADMVRAITESVAAAATREAVSVVLKDMKALPSLHVQDCDASERSHEEDFEISSNATELRSGLTSGPSSGGVQGVKRGEGSVSESLTPMASDRDERDSELTTLSGEGGSNGVEEETGITEQEETEEEETEILEELEDKEVEEKRVRHRDRMKTVTGVVCGDASAGEGDIDEVCTLMNHVIHAH